MTPIKKFTTPIKTIYDKILNNLIVYFSNIAGNSEPFRKILDILNKAGIGSPAQVFSLHQLTR